MLLTRQRDDDLAIRQALLEFLTEPFDGVVIAVDEEDFFRAEFDGVVGDGVAGGVAAEVEDARLAFERHAAVGVVQFHGVAGFGRADAAAKSQ